MIDEVKLAEVLADPGSLALHCMICAEPLPAARARDSKRTTCCPECYKALKAFRKEMTRRRYCPSCLHPSSPAERADYKQWRTERGQRKGNREDGRPPKKRQEALAVALTDVLESLKGVEGFEAPLKSGGDSQEERAARVAKVEQAVASAAKLLDPQPVR